MSVIDRMLEEWFEQEPWHTGMANGIAEQCVERAKAVLSVLNLTQAQAAALMDGSAVVVPREPPSEALKESMLLLHRAMIAASQHEETKR